MARETTYTDDLSAEAQIDAEELIAGYIYSLSQADVAEDMDEEKAADFGRLILLQVIQRICPDLIEGKE